MSTLRAVSFAVATLLLPFSAHAQQFTAQQQYVSSLAVALLSADGEVDALRQQLAALTKERDELQKQLAAAKKPADAAKP